MTDKKRTEGRSKWERHAPALRAMRDDEAMTDDPIEAALRRALSSTCEHGLNGPCALCDVPEGMSLSEAVLAGHLTMEQARGLRDAPSSAP